MNKTTPPPTNKQLAEALHVSTRRVGQLKAIGLPCQSINAAVEWKRTHISGAADSAELLRQSRVALVNSQREKIDQENRLRSGELCLSAEAFAGGLATGSAMKAAFLRLLGDLPPRLEGCTAIQIFTIMRDEFHRLLSDMSHGDKYFNTPEMDRLLEEFHAARPQPWIPPRKSNK